MPSTCLSCIGIVRFRDIDHGAGEHRAAAALQLLVKAASTREPQSPAGTIAIPRWCPSLSTRRATSCASSDGREGELEKERRRLLAVRQKVERQQRRALYTVHRRGRDRLPRQRSHDDVRACLRRLGDLVGDGLLAAGVVDANDGTLLQRRLVVRTEEAVTHAGGQRTRGTADGQQQGDVRLRRQRLRLLAEKLATHDRRGGMAGVVGQPGGQVGRCGRGVVCRLRCQRRQLQPAADHGIGLGPRAES